MIIEIPDGIIETYIQEHIKKMISRETRKYIEDMVKEEVEKRSRKLYPVVSDWAYKEVNDRFERELGRHVTNEMERCFREYHWGKVESDEEIEAFKQGAHAAYLAMSNFPSDETINKAIKSAGECLANNIRINPTRYKRLAEVLAEKAGEKRD